MFGSARFARSASVVVRASGVAWGSLRSVRRPGSSRVGSLLWLCGGRGSFPSGTAGSLASVGWSRLREAPRPPLRRDGPLPWSLRVLELPMGKDPRPPRHGPGHKRHKLEAPEAPPGASRAPHAAVSVLCLRCADGRGPHTLIPSDHLGCPTSSEGRVPTRPTDRDSQRANHHRAPTSEASL